MFCIVVWGNAGITTLDRLIILQKRAIRLITYSNFCAHTNPLFSKLNILKFTDLYILQILLFVNNCIYPPCSKHLCSFFYNFKYDFHNSIYPTRISHKTIKIPYFRTELRRNSTICMGAILYNKYHFIMEAPSTLILKRQIKAYFANLY